MDRPVDTHALARAARMSAIQEPARRTIVSSSRPRPDRVRSEEVPEPRLELFHFVMSICSQKSRAALFEAGLEYASNELLIAPPANENYAEAYVALRMSSDGAAARPLVSGYSGATNVAEEGFDPLVVPTLVDHAAGAVITDSRAIALYADHLSGGALIPADRAEAVMTQVDIVDSLAHAGLLYGANPDGDQRPAAVQVEMKDAHLRKIEQVERRKAELPSDSPLHAAYAHKIMKERAGHAFIADPGNMRGIIADTRAAIATLDATLGGTDGDWVAGDRFTLADVFWGVSLFRLLYLGYGWMWTDMQTVVSYSELCFERPSIKNAAILWPGHPPGDTIARWIK